nr:hypothetical protein [Tanacetum cinerariifolium]
MGDEHLDTIPATESDEVIKSSVEDLVPIPSESEGIPDTMCDVHLVHNPTPLEAKDHFKIVINSNDDYSSSDDDSLYNKNIENLPDPGEWISILNSKIRENLSSTTRVNLPVEDDHSPLLAYVVKDKQEKDKIRTKPDKNGKRGKAQQCRSPVTVKKAEKEKKIQIQRTKNGNPKRCIRSRNITRTGIAIKPKKNCKD